MTKLEWKIGDCIALMQEYSDNHFDLILTDPPYGINICSSGKIGGDNRNVKATNYGIIIWDQKRIDKEYFDEMLRVSKNQIIFGGNYYTDYLPPTPCWIVWDKDNSGNFADCELAWTSFKTAVRMIKYRWNGMLQGNMKNKEKRVHPTQKPLPLFKWILEKYSNEGDLICDPFLGSGTTLEACYQTGRNCIGFEIDPRWEKLYSIRSHKCQGNLGDWF